MYINKFIGALENDTEIIEISKKYYEEYMYTYNPIYKTFEFELFDFKLENKTNFVLKIEEIVAMILRSAK